MSFWTRDLNQNQDFSHLTDSPPDSFWSKWFIGVILALGLVIYAFICFITQKGFLPADSSFAARGMFVKGHHAIALGFAYLAIGIFSHAQFFWGAIYDNYFPADLAKIISAVMFLASAGYLIVRIGMGI